MQVTNDIESTLCQSCTKYRTKIDCLLTDKRWTYQDTKNHDGGNKSVDITYRNMYS